MTETTTSEPPRVDPRYYADGATWERDIARRNRNSRALAWIVAAVWKVAPNAKDPRYGVMAQALTVGWAINTVLIAFFLGLQMVRALVGG